MTNRIELLVSKSVPFAGGQAFGDAGPYERLRGRAHFAVDPLAPAQAGVTDIGHAQLSGAGMVEFSAEFFIFRPVDPARGNRRIFFDYGNRGNLRALQYFNDAPGSNDPLTAAQAGNGFLFRRGYSLVWAAWQGDLLPGDGRITMDLPVAHDNGKPIMGPVRQEFIPVGPTVCFPLSGRIDTRSHPAASHDTTLAQLTRRRYPDSKRIAIPSDAWSFAQATRGLDADSQVKARGGGALAILPSDEFIYMADGFQPGWIYELVYTARDPLVMGLGHVAVRDLVSHLKHGEADAAGNPNPLPGIEKAYGFGRSQTGRCLRDFIYRGFNADAAGRRVFDGVIPHVAGAGKMWLNHRFANGVAMAGQQYEDHHNIADSFPFSYAETTDHLTGRTDAILKRPDTDPFVMHTQSASEYWQRKASLVHTDTRGNDLPQPDNVRVYFWASSQHTSDPVGVIPARGVCENYNNVVAVSPVFRALLDALDAWVTDGAAPPDSRIPRRADGTAIPYAEWRAQFPAIPGAKLPTGPAQLSLLDFGPEADRGIASKQPPDVLAKNGYTILVPAVDADGNDIAGIRAPMVQAPLGTYTGWNLRIQGLGTGANYEFLGSYIPFMDTAEEREFTGDPRASVTERYGSPEGYVEAITAAAQRLVAEGFLLEEDAERAAEEARNWGRPRHLVRL
ncbi:MAG: alpha/beta hydrolase domain-containing protein [Alphaproteobacteria bacterium]